VHRRAAGRSCEGVEIPGWREIFNSYSSFDTDFHQSANVCPRDGIADDRLFKSSSTDVWKFLDVAGDCMELAAKVCAAMGDAVALIHSGSLIPIGVPR
jgi:hypothetical protein